MSRQQTTDFLVRVSSNPDLLARFENDPAGVIAKFGLSAEQADVLLRRDPDAIREFLIEARNGDPVLKKKKKKVPKKKTVKKPTKKGTAKKK